MKQLIKTPAEVDFFGADFSTDIPEDDEITAVEWDVPDGLTGTEDSFSGLLASIKLAGGVLGTSYVLTATAETEDGRTVQKSFELVIVEFSI